MLGKKLINAGPVGSSGPTPSNYFNTVLYTGNGGTQRVGGYINKGAVFNGSSSKITLPNSTEGIGETDSSFSFWVYPVSVSSGYEIVALLTNNDWIEIRYNSSGQFQIYPARQSNGTYISFSAVSKAANNWYNIVITRDSATSTIKLYIDGSLVETNTSWDGTLTSAASDPNGLGANVSSNTLHFSGKLDQVRIFDKALSSSEVTTLYGETYASTTISTTDIFNDNSGVALYQLDGNANDTGTNDFEHHFFVSDAGSSSSSVRLNSTDADFTYTRPSGYSEWGGAFDVNNQSHQFAGNSSYVTLSESNKKWDKSGSQYNAIWGENSYSSGKYYFELEYLGAELFFGIIKQSTATTLYDGNVVKENSISYGSWNTTSYKYSTTNSSQGTALSTNDVLGFAVDFDNRELKYYINNTLQDTTSLQEIIYNGTATNVTYQEATNFSPDLVWIKRRNGVSNHVLFDSVRGVYMRLHPDTTDSQASTSPNGLTNFDSNGFTVVDNSGGGTGVNGSSMTYAAWCFNAGTDAAVSNTDGTITSTVKANTDAGFSVVKWTGNGTNGATIGHGLSNSPEIIITKGLSNPTSWVVGIGGVSGFGVNDYMTLQTTAAKGSSSTFYQAYGTDTFTVGVSAANEMNKNSSNDYISYCFHSVDGIQKVGSYQGNGSTNGPIVTTGFEPAFLMVKNATASGDRWVIWDNARDTSNTRTKGLSPNLSSAEITGFDVDFLSNGFQIVDAEDALNDNGETFIYLAIAADPDTTTPIVEDSFEVVTYTGNGGTQSIDTGFKPDFVWVKQRTGSASNHLLFDSVRGPYKQLNSNQTYAETDRTSVDKGLTSFDSNGFTVKDTSAGDYEINGANGGTYSGDGSYVAWCWKAGDHDDNLPQINTEGTIDSIVSVNDAAGFSIVKWTGDGVSSATVGHGLSSVPEMIITKSTSEANDWNVNHIGIPNKLLYLHSTIAAFSGGGTNGAFGYQSTNTATTFQFTAGSSGVNNVNKSGQQYIAYCFTSVTGYQKIGSYTGNGSTQDINVGFEPRFLILKETSSSGSWFILDNARGDDVRLLANVSDAEAAFANASFLSNGFQVTSGSNSNNTTYIYLAIA